MNTIFSVILAKKRNREKVCFCKANIQTLNGNGEKKIFAGFFFEKFMGLTHVINKMINTFQVKVYLLEKSPVTKNGRRESTRDLHFWVISRNIGVKGSETFTVSRESKGKCENKNGYQWYFILGSESREKYE